MSGFELPGLEYCSLERAVRFIGNGCEVGDLLHWAKINAIKLMINFGFPGDFDGKKDCYGRVYFSESIGLYENLKGICGLAGVSDHSFFPSAASYFSLTEEDVLDYEFNYKVTPIVPTVGADYVGLDCNLGGLWEVSNFQIEGDRVCFFYMHPFRNSCNWIKYARYWDGDSFSVGDLFISRESIEKIIGRKLRVLPSDLGDLNKAKTPHTDEENPRTKGFRASFIKSLLSVCYGDDVADSPRKFFENPRSKLRADFEKKRIKPPSGKIVEQWLKDVDIDRY